MNYDTIVVSGGGLKGLVSLGCLHYFYENKHVTPISIKRYSGTSVGSMICLLLSCGYTPMEIFAEVYTTESFFDNRDLGFELSIQGIYNISAVTKKVKTMMIKKIGYNPTFQQLYDFSKDQGNENELYICGTNVDKLKPEYFSHITHPDMLVIDAVDISCNLPFVFKKIQYQGMNYVDGGISNNVPIDIFEGKSYNILCVVTRGNFELKNSSLPSAIAHEIEYLSKLVMIPINSITEMSIRRLEDRYPSSTLMKIPVANIPFIAQELSSEQKMFYFKYGYNFAKIENNKITLN